MISSLNGKVESLGSEWAIINVGGIGFQVFMPTPTLSTMGTTGKEVRLFTHLHLREDNVTLYGFASADELALFQSLISVSGLGPKMGLAMLSAMINALSCYHHELAELASREDDEYLAARLISKIRTIAAFSAAWSL